MTTTKQDTGQRAEKIAVDYLRQQGFKIRNTNWRFGHKEIDIAAEKDGRIHIVEVRSLNSSFFQEPYQSIDRQKQRNLIAAAHAYITHHKLTMEVQLDVISVVFNGDAHTLDYLPNAIYPKA
jgi:putative endonuclease